MGQTQKAWSLILFVFSTCICLSLAEDCLEFGAWYRLNEAGSSSPRDNFGDTETWQDCQDACEGTAWNFHPYEEFTSRCECFVPSEIDSLEREIVSERPDITSCLNPPCSADCPDNSCGNCLETAGAERPGCSHAVIRNCVCGTENHTYCCADEWDQGCVDTAFEDCCHPETLVYPIVLSEENILEDFPVHYRVLFDSGGGTDAVDFAVEARANSANVSLTVIPKDTGYMENMCHNGFGYAGIGPVAQCAVDSVTPHDEWLIGVSANESAVVALTVTWLECQYLNEELDRGVLLGQHDGVLPERELLRVSLEWTAARPGVVTHFRTRDAFFANISSAALLSSQGYIPEFSTLSCASISEFDGDEYTLTLYEPYLLEAGDSVFVGIDSLFPSGLILEGYDAFTAMVKENVDDSACDNPESGSIAEVAAPLQVCYGNGFPEGCTDCIVPHPELGCGNIRIATQVCRNPEYSYCCTLEWDEGCVDEAMNALTEVPSCYDGGMVFFDVLWQCGFPGDAPQGYGAIDLAPLFRESCLHLPHDRCEFFLNAASLNVGQSDLATANCTGSPTTLDVDYSCGIGAGRTALGVGFALDMQGRWIRLDCTGIHIVSMVYGNDEECISSGLNETSTDVTDLARRACDGLEVCAVDVPDLVAQSGEVLCTNYPKTRVEFYCGTKPAIRRVVFESDAGVEDTHIECPPITPPPPLPESSCGTCLQTNQLIQGCSHPEVEACVCVGLSHCCNDGWAEDCVEEAHVCCFDTLGVKEVQNIQQLNITGEPFFPAHYRLPLSAASADLHLRTVGPSGAALSISAFSKTNTSSIELCTSARWAQSGLAQCFFSQTMVSGLLSSADLEDETLTFFLEVSMGSSRLDVQLTVSWIDCDQQNEGIVGSIPTDVERSPTALAIEYAPPFAGPITSIRASKLAFQDLRGVAVYEGGDGSVGAQLACGTHQSFNNADFVFSFAAPHRVASSELIRLGLESDFPADGLQIPGALSMSALRENVLPGDPELCERVFDAEAADEEDKIAVTVPLEVCFGNPISEHCSDCLTRHSHGGCENPRVNECVCGELRSCCGAEWSQNCVDFAARHCPGGCTGGGAIVQDVEYAISVGNTSFGSQPTTIISLINSQCLSSEKCTFSLRADHFGEEVGAQDGEISLELEATYTCGLAKQGVAPGLVPKVAAFAEEDFVTRDLELDCSGISVVEAVYGTDDGCDSSASVRVLANIASCEGTYECTLSVELEDGAEHNCGAEAAAQLKWFCGGDSDTLHEWIVPLPSLGSTFTLTCPGAPPSPAPTPGPTPFGCGNCANTVGDGRAGCDVQHIQDTICEHVNPSCCTSWSGECAGQALQLQECRSQLTRLYPGEVVEGMTFEIGVTYQYYTYVHPTTTDFFAEVFDTDPSADFEVHAEVVAVDSAASQFVGGARCDDHLVGPRAQCFIAEVVAADDLEGRQVTLGVELIMVIEVTALSTSVNTTLSMTFRDCEETNRSFNRTTLSSAVRSRSAFAFQVHPFESDPTGLSLTELRVDAVVFLNARSASIYRGPVPTAEGQLVAPALEVACLGSPTSNGRDLIFEIAPPLRIPEGDPAQLGESYWIAVESDFPVGDVLDVSNIELLTVQQAWRDDGIAADGTVDICAHDWSASISSTTTQPYGLCQGSEYRGDCSDCLRVHEHGGCRHAAVQQEVCDSEPSCCRDGWTLNCVAIALSNTYLCDTSGFYPNPSESPAGEHTCIQNSIYPTEMLQKCAGESICFYQPLESESCTDSSAPFGFEVEYKCTPNSPYGNRAIYDTYREVVVVKCTGIMIDSAQYGGIMTDPTCQQDFYSDFEMCNGLDECVVLFSPPPLGLREACGNQYQLVIRYFCESDGLAHDWIQPYPLEAPLNISLVCPRPPPVLPPPTPIACGETKIFSMIGQVDLLGSPAHQDGVLEFDHPTGGVVIFEILFEGSPLLYDMKLHIYDDRQRQVVSRPVVCRTCRYNDQTCIEEKCKPQDDELGETEPVSYYEFFTANLDQGSYFFIIEAAPDPMVGPLLFRIQLSCELAQCQSSFVSSLELDVPSRAYVFDHLGGRAVIHTCAAGTNVDTVLKLNTIEPRTPVSVPITSGPACAIGQSYIEAELPMGKYEIIVESAFLNNGVGGDFELVIECEAFDHVADVECGSPAVSYLMENAFPLFGAERYPVFRWFHPGGAFSISTCNPGTNFDTRMGLFPSANFQDQNFLVVNDDATEGNDGCSTIEVDRLNLPLDGGVYYILVVSANLTLSPTDTVELSVTSCGEVQCGGYFDAEIRDDEDEGDALVYRVFSEQKFYHIQTCFEDTQVETSVRVFNDSSRSHEANPARESCGASPGENVLAEHPALDSGEFYVTVGGQTGGDGGTFKIFFECPEFLITPAPTPVPAIGPPDLAMTAIIGNSGGRILCDFNQIVVRLQSLFCGDVVAAESMSTLGTGATCSFSTNFQMVIVLGTGATIQIGELLTVENVRSASDPGASAPRLSTPVLAPLNPPTVVAAISGPREFGSCGDLQLSALSSTGSASRPFAYSWELQDEEPTLSNLAEFVASQFGNTLTISKDDLSVSTVLRVSLTVTNWLGGSGNATFVVTVSPENLPIVSGDSSVRTRSGAYVLYKVLVDLPCENQRVASYEWTAFTEETPAGITPTRQLELSSTQRSSFGSLRIFPNTLEPGQFYAFQVVVTTSEGTTGSHVFAVLAAPPDAFAVSSTERAICVDSTCDDLALVAEESFEISNELLRANAVYAWRCSFISGPLAPVAFASPCFNESLSNSLFGDRNNSRPTVTMSPDVLRPLGTGKMLFDVSMFPSAEFIDSQGVNANLSYAATFNVSLLPLEVVAPSILIRPLKIRKVSADKRVSLEVQVTFDGDSADLRFEWRSLSENFDLSNSSLLLSDLNSPFLVFAPNSLLAGVEYVFEAIVSVAGQALGPGANDDPSFLLEQSRTMAVPIGAGNSDQFVRHSKSGLRSTKSAYASDIHLLQETSTATASISFATNFPPTGGSCSVLTEGVALKTPFVLACSEWSDDEEDLPLQYRFVLNPGTPRVTILTQRTELSSSQALLAPGNHTVLAEIRDNLGATSSVTFAVHVPDIELDNADQTQTEFVEQNVIGELETATAEEALQLIVAVTDVFDANPTSNETEIESRQDVRASLFDRLEEVTDEQAETQTSDEIEQVLLVSATLSSESTEIGGLRQALPEFVDRVVGVALTGEFAEDGVTQGIATAALTALGQSGNAESDESATAAAEFATVFDDVVFQVARGVVQDAFAGEIATVVNTNEISLHARRTLFDNVEPVVQIDGAALDVPPSVLSGVDRQNVTSVVLSFMRYVNSLFPTNGPRGLAVSPDGISTSALSSRSSKHALETVPALTSVVDTVSSGLGLMDAENLEKGAPNNEKFQAFREEAISLFSISGTIQVTYYDGTSDFIDKNDKREIGVSDLHPCEAIRLNISHVDDDATLDELFLDGGPPTVCRHTNGNLTELFADCVTVEFTRDWTVCNCTHLTFFDVGGWGDFVPSVNTLTPEDFRNMTPENVRRHPSGILSIVLISVIFIIIFLYAHVHDIRVLKRAATEKTTRTPSRSQLRNMHTKAVLKGSKLVKDDDFQWLIVHDEALSWREKISGVWRFRIKNKHKWLGMFFRKSRSRFQTRERATVLYIYILSTLAIGAVFHGRKENVADWITIGFASSLFSLFPSLLMTQLFINTRSKTQEKVFGGTYVSKQAIKRVAHVRKRSRNLSASYAASQGSLSGAGESAKKDKDGAKERSEIELAPVKSARHLSVSNEPLPQPFSPTPPKTPMSVVVAEEEKKPEKSRVQRFFEMWSSGILEGDEGADDDMNSDGSKKKAETFPPWVNTATYVFAAVWALGCMLLILVFNLQFDLEDELPEFYYDECARDFVSADDVRDLTAWALSIVLANAVDFFITQPFSLLLLSVYTVIKVSRSKDDGMRSLDTLEELEDRAGFDEEYTEEEEGHDATERVPLKHKDRSESEKKERDATDDEKSTRATDLSHGSEGQLSKTNVDDASSSTASEHSSENKARKTTADNEASSTASERSVSQGGANSGSSSLKRKSSISRTSEK